MLSAQSNACALCGRQRRTTFHHLIPRTCHSNKWFKKHFTKDDMKTRGIEVCRECHKCIHLHISEKELGRRYNTREALLQHEKIRTFVRWVRKRQ